MKTLKQTSLFFLLAGITFTSCNDDDCKDCEIDESRRIILSSYVTMGVEPRLQEDQIEQGQALSLYITPSGTTNEVLYSDVEIIANGNGGFVSENMYFPIDGRNIDLYAVHPYIDNVPLNSTIDFSIKINQSEEGNYLNSDLLFATRMNQSYANNPISLIFSHKLAKMDITIETNDGLDLSALSSFSVTNIRPSTSINILNGDIAMASGDLASIDVYRETINPASKASVSDIHAIVIPQTIPAYTQLFRFMIGDQVYTYTTTSDFTLLAGNSHKVTLTISAGQISLESEIIPWIKGGSIGGEVTPE